MNIYLGLLSCILLNTKAVRSWDHEVSSELITDWGVWGSMSRCPYNNFVVSWTQKVAPDKGPSFDNTALNGVRMNCASLTNIKNVTATISSTEGPSGNWGDLFSCSPSVMVGFNLRSESDQGENADDTAANNMRAICTDSRQIDGVGGSRGSWRTDRYCNYRHAVCGIQTQVEPYQMDDDNTGLNNIKLHCCQLPNMAKTCSPEENYITAAVCDNSESNSESKCEYSYNVGVGYTSGSEAAGKGWEEAGFKLEDAVKDLRRNFVKSAKNENTKSSFNLNVFTKSSPVSSVAIVPAGVKTTLSYLTATCAHYSISTRKIRREDVSKSGQVIAVAYIDI